MVPPSAPSSAAAVSDMPSATPACGKSVMPRYFSIIGSQCVALALQRAPKYLPAERKMMYTTPTATMAQSANTSRRSAAPLSTKNRQYSGAVHLSSLSMRSSAIGQRLQNTVPSIMHVKSGENPNTSGPARSSVIDSATVSVTVPMSSVMRLRLEWK